MVVRLEIHGAYKVANMFKNLSKEFVKEIDKNLFDWMRAIRKSAKLRAPRQTGFLAQSIKLDKGKSNKVEYILHVDAPYAAAQEYGFTPHLVGPTAFTNRPSLITIGESYESKFNMPIFKGLFVRKHTPFITPAIEMQLNKIGEMFSRTVTNAISKSKKGGR